MPRQAGSILMLFSALRPELYGLGELQLWAHLCAHVRDLRVAELSDFPTTSSRRHQTHPTWGNYLAATGNRNALFNESARGRATFATRPNVACLIGLGSTFLFLCYSDALTGLPWRAPHSSWAGAVFSQAQYYMCCLRY